MMPEFIVVELDLDQFIVAQRITDTTYRKFVAAVGRPSAEATQAALVNRDQPDPVFDPATRRVRDEARIRIEKDDEGIIEGRRDDPDRG